MEFGRKVSERLDNRLISQHVDTMNMGIGKTLRERALDDPESVNIEELRKGLHQPNGEDLRHATDAARKVAYSKPEAAQRLRGELEKVLSDPLCSGSAVSNARKALEYLPEEGTQTQTRSHVDAGAEDLRQLAMRRPESVNGDELASHLTDGDPTAVRHATEAARKVAYTRESTPALSEPLETVANGSQYSSSVRESARTALNYLGDAGTADRGTDHSSERNTVVFDGKESELDTGDDTDHSDTTVFSENEGLTGTTGGSSDESESAVNFCPNCGTDLRRFDSVNFCAECGAEL